MNQTGSFKTLHDWLPWLESLSPREIVLGLERVAAVLEELELPRADRVINIAGTNGKGSSVAMFDALFTSAGHKAGCYTSPHLMRYNERIRIGGLELGDCEIIAAFERVQAARGDVPLTYFEFGTLAALVAFADAGADTLILEVGMGGRLDAVNAVEPDACLITNISLDHMAWLGSDPESIAAEKAGIMRAGKPAVFGSAEHSGIIKEHAVKIGADLRVAGEDFHFERNEGAHVSWSWQGREHQLTGLRAPALAGDIQLQNAAAVLAVIEAMGLGEMLSSSMVNGALGAVKLEGRFQVINARRSWVLDVAHNPASAAVLAGSLQQLAHDGPVTAVIGVLADKDVAGIVAPLSKLVDSWVAVPLAGTRAEPAAVLAQKIANCTSKPCRVADSIPGALEAADQHADPDALVLVTGSFYTVGPALEWLNQNRT